MALSDRPAKNSVLYKEDGTAYAVDALGILGVASPGHSIAQGSAAGLNGLIAGYIATSATTIVAVRGTAYTEPTAAAQVELVSSSSSDSAAGTGARTVKVTYYDGLMDGPFTETVTMNGTTAVATVATDIRFIEKMETLTVGSNGTNVGTITIRHLSDSPVYGTIAASDGITFWAHHYVPSGKKCFITRLVAGTQGASGSVFIRVARPLTANSFEKQVTSRYRVVTAQPSQIYDLEPQFWVEGPARVTVYLQPDAVTANTCHVGFAFYEA